MHVIHPADVGSAVVHALTAPGGIYNVGAEPVQRRDYVDTIAQAAGKKQGRFLPSWVERLGRGQARDPHPFTARQLPAVQRPYGLASDLSQADSGLVRCPRLSLSCPSARSNAVAGPPSCSAISADTTADDTDEGWGETPAPTSDEDYLTRRPAAPRLSESAATSLISRSSAMSSGTISGSGS